METNILLLYCLVLIGLSNLLMTFILNAKKCKDELKHWEALHNLNDKFHHYKK